MTKNENNDAKEVPTKEERERWKYRLTSLGNPLEVKDSRRLIAALEYVERERDAAQFVSRENDRVFGEVVTERDALRAQLASHPIESPELIHDFNAEEEGELAWKVKVAVQAIAKSSNWSEKAILEELQPFTLAASSNAKRLREAEGLLRRADYLLMRIGKGEELGKDIDAFLSPTPCDEIEKGPQ